jgi:hypothetical protein
MGEKTTLRDGADDTDPNGSPLANSAGKTSTWSKELEAVLEQWRLRAWAAQIAHYKVASRLRKNNIQLGLPVVILTTAVGTSLFATLSEEELSLVLRIALGSVSLGAAILGGAQTFFGFAQRADRHVIAADWYASIRRKIEQQLATPKSGRGEPKEFLDQVRKEMNNVGSQSPEIGERTWNQVASSFGLEEPPGADEEGRPPHREGR